MGISLQGEDSRGDHGLGRLVEFRFKAPPGTISSSITTHTSLGQRNCASWASQPPKSVTLLPCPGGRTTKSTKGHVVALGRKKNIKLPFQLQVFIRVSSSVTFRFHTPTTTQPASSGWAGYLKFQMVGRYPITLPGKVRSILQAYAIFHGSLVLIPGYHIESTYNCILPNLFHLNKHRRPLIWIDERNPLHLK